MSSHLTSQLTQFPALDFPVSIHYFALRLSFAENWWAFSKIKPVYNPRNSLEGHYRWSHTSFVSFYSVLQLQPSWFCAFQPLCSATFSNNQPIFFCVMLRVLNTVLEVCDKTFAIRLVAHLASREDLCSVWAQPTCSTGHWALEGMALENRSFSLAPMPSAVQNQLKVRRKPGEASCCSSSSCWERHRNAWQECRKLQFSPGPPLLPRTNNTRINLVLNI